MQMTEAEIVKSYQRAEKKREQIKILAELNDCPKQDIRDILEKNGEEVPKTGNRYTKIKEELEDPGKTMFGYSLETDMKKTKAKGSKRQQETTDCKDCSMTRKTCCSYDIKPDGVHCDAFTPKLLLKNEEQTESSKVSAPSDSSKLMSRNEVGTHQQDVGTKSEKVITLGNLIDLIDRDRENNKTISIMDENGEEQLRVITWSPFLEDLEDYAVTSLDVGDSGWICVWLGEKKVDE